MKNKQAAIRKPKIKGKLPGPKCKALVDIDKKVVSTSYTRSYPFVIAKGEGVWATDVDGNEFLDCTAGIAVNSTGHNHPKVVEAIQKQLAKFIHMSGTDFYYEEQIRLAQKLSEIVPGPKAKRTFFTNSGAESIECAMKLVRYHTRREKLLAFMGGFHGRTFGAMSLSASKAIHRHGFSPLLPGIVHAPFPDPYRPWQNNAETVAKDTLSFIEDRIFRYHAGDEFAGVFIEPIQGEGGYVAPATGFIAGLSKLAKKYGILLVLDEVQSGFGRTGKMWGFEHENVTPDVVALAKGIASGMPLGAVVAPAKIMSWESGAHANTFGGNPLSCAAALATIDLLEHGLIENASKVGEHVKSRLETELADHPSVGEVRGRGLMLAFDIVKDKKTKAPDGALRNKIVDKAYHKGLLLLGAGPSAVRFCPGLVISKDESDVAIDIIVDIVRNMR
ncbi:MAG: acetyl ornithine aminotransferase family protein [Planctomycetes bacterium]|nr:acetyl ornithine aminotransferase family protein [Planctomycetota bacterium]